MPNQDWRSFLRMLETEHPSEVLHFKEEIDPAYEITAFMNELEKQGPAPAVIFERVKGSAVPVVANLSGSRKRLAAAFGVAEKDLWAEYSRRMKSPVPEKHVGDCPARDKIFTGGEVDILSLPILTHFAEDPAP
ncbi:MAG TPA: UbiD family decarboxylase, partial [Thermodesulfobacteriota bacterium]|nr:UbiD family decarboxylase [Thermodesulfobacteriota bacterium]